MTLQARLDAFKADFRAGKPPYNVPASVIATMDRATGELIASGAAARALKTGDLAPDFSLTAPDGTQVGAGELLAKGPQLDAADARPFRHRSRPRYPLCGGEPRLHASAGAA